MFGGLKKIAKGAFGLPGAFKAVKSLIDGPKPPKVEKIKEEDPDIAAIKAATGGDDILDAIRKRVAAEQTSRGRAGLVIPLKGSSGLQL